MIDTRRVRTSPAFYELERKRTRFSWTLTVIMLAIYFAYIALVAFKPEWMAVPVFGVITLGFPLGVGVILSAIVLTGVYVLRANGEYDRLTRQVLEQSR